jgi:hypothetical protein
MGVCEGRAIVRLRGATGGMADPTSLQRRLVQIVGTLWGIRANEPHRDASDRGRKSASSRVLPAGRARACVARHRRRFAAQVPFPGRSPIVCARSSAHVNGLPPRRETGRPHGDRRVRPLEAICPPGASADRSGFFMVVAVGHLLAPWWGYGRTVLSRCSGTT